MSNKKKSVIREYAEAIIIAVVLALIIRSFVVQAFKIPSGSMEPTLLIGDHILVNKFLYGIKIPFTDIRLFPIRHPQRGDIIVFVYPVEPDKDFIKRIIGVPGDAVEIKNKLVYINGTPLNDPYGVHVEKTILPAGIQPRDNFGPVRVPEHRYFVMGDNRDRSYDSRFWGFVGESAIKGKAFIIYWSKKNHFYNVRWNRLGKIIR
ncbi:MAG: signal peptidase I [Deltaproteobacteria bacterium]|nr:signal peptidase I [Deltaproteobacteria bacterium]MBW2308148.1 signal peptidase I [Deltaproteobacteria bacterium]